MLHRHRLIACLAGLVVGVVAVGKPGTTPQAALIVTLGVGVFAYAVGSVPSARPTRKTASHSRPLAECSDASVTPSTVGACCCSARLASSSLNAARVGSR